MRDDILISSQNNYKGYRKTTGALIANVTTTHISKRTFRDEITRGVIHLGPSKYPYGWREPTDYRAFFGSVGVYPFDVDGKVGSQINRYVGISSTGNVGGGQLAYYGCTNVQYPVPVVPNFLANQVRVETLLKIADNDFNVGVFLAEMNKTSLMVYTTAMLLLRSLKQLKRGNVQNALRIIGIRSGVRGRIRPEDAWLTYQYGWIPLINDIYDGVEIIRNWSQKSPTLCSASRTVSRYNPIDSTTLPLGFGGLANGTSEVGMRKEIFFTVSDPWAAFMSSLGLLNPAEIAWELVPYSFVFDWLVPVGNFLRATTSFIGIKPLMGYETSFVKNRFTVEYMPQGSIYQGGVRPKLTVKSFAMQRLRVAGLPHARPYIKPIGKVLSTQRLITLIALLVQLRRG